jgi:glycerol-3-phosphate dehydrogenase (NAD(P)+)
MPESSFNSDTKTARPRIGVLGAGSYGLTLAQCWASQGKSVWIWGRRPEVLQQAMSDDTVRIPFSDSPLLLPRPNTLKALQTLTYECLAETDILVLAVTSQGTFEAATHLARLKLPPSVVLVNVSKGLVSTEAATDDTLLLQSEVLQNALPHNPLAILSGPCLAKELAQGLPTAVSVASHSAGLAEALMSQLSHDTCLRIYANADVMGVELGGALKNIYAIGSGYLHEMALGHNALSAYLTRSLAEMTRFAVACGADTQTLSGLSGLGDLMTTCHSPLSRNYQIGVRLAKGQPLVEVMTNLVGVAEGIETTHRVVSVAASLGVELPLACAIQRLLRSDDLGVMPPAEVIQSLMSRRLVSETLMREMPTR